MDERNDQTGIRLRKATGDLNLFNKFYFFHNIFLSLPPEKV